MREIQVRTRARCEMVNITREVETAAQESGLKEGWVAVFVPHTTAGITLNESADPAVAADLLAALEETVPRRESYRHREGNADSHVKASLVGSSVLAPIAGGRLALGTWQGVFLCEFDGPRLRRVLLEPLGTSQKPIGNR